MRRHHRLLRHVPKPLEVLVDAAGKAHPRLATNEAFGTPLALLRLTEHPEASAASEALHAVAHRARRVEKQRRMTPAHSLGARAARWASRRDELVVHAVRGPALVVVAKEAGVRVARRAVMNHVEVVVGVAAAVPDLEAERRLQAHCNVVRPRVVAFARRDLEEAQRAPRVDDHGVGGPHGAVVAYGHLACSALLQMASTHWIAVDADGPGVENRIPRLAERSLVVVAAASRPVAPIVRHLLGEAVRRVRPVGARVVVALAQRAPRRMLVLAGAAQAAQPLSKLQALRVRTDAARFARDVGRDAVEAAVLARVRMALHHLIARAVGEALDGVCATARRLH